MPTRTSYDFPFTDFQQSGIVTPARLPTADPATGQLDASFAALGVPGIPPWGVASSVAAVGIDVASPAAVGVSPAVAPMPVSALNVAVHVSWLFQALIETLGGYAETFIGVRAFIEEFGPAFRVLESTQTLHASGAAVLGFDPRFGESGDRVFSFSFPALPNTSYRIWADLVQRARAVHGVGPSAAVSNCGMSVLSITFTFA